MDTYEIKGDYRAIVNISTELVCEIRIKVCCVLCGQEWVDLTSHYQGHHGSVRLPDGWTSIGAGCVCPAHKVVAVPQDFDVHGINPGEKGR